MKHLESRRRRQTASWTAIFLLIAVSVACSNSSPTEPEFGPGPIDPIGPQGSGIDGSGVFVEENRPVSGFAGIRLTSVASVFIEQSGSDSLVVRAEDNVISHILTDVIGGVLEITTEAGVSFDDIGPIQVFVTAQDLSRIELNGVGDMQVMGLGFRELDLDLNGTGNMDLTGLDGEQLLVRMDGVGQIAIEGRVTEQTVRVSGVGDYKGKKLRSVRANVTVNNIGSATVRVSQYLAATVTGMGSIYYYGDPTVESDISGSGSVIQQGG